MKIEDLKVGDELVCVDCDYFKDKALNSNGSQDIKDALSVVSIDPVILLKNENTVLTIFNSEIKYFKKKEQPTFNDLIDVAVQAFKDKVLYNLNVRGNYIEFNITQGYTAYFDDTYIEGGIEEIQALYKETFVINEISDIQSIRKKAKITLINGFESIAYTDAYQSTGSLVVDLITHYGYTDQSIVKYADFYILKGATVEQERSR